jgi:anti-sigma factor RsiW
MSDKQQLHALVDRLPEAEAATRYLQFLISRDEEPVDPAMLARIDAARNSPAPGIAHEDVLREFGL